MTKNKKNQINKSSKKSVSYDDWLMQQLKDHNVAAEYLNNSFKEYVDNENSIALISMALRNVIMANGGVAKIAKKAGLGRESLYKTISVTGNPEFKTIITLTHALGLELKFV